MRYCFKQKQIVFMKTNKMKSRNRIKNIITSINKKLQIRKNCSPAPFCVSESSFYNGLFSTNQGKTEYFSPSSASLASASSSEVDGINSAPIKPL